MANDGTNRKKYAAPVIVPLGELAIGANECSNGSGAVNLCTPGMGAGASCTTGTHAQAACKDGINPLAACNPGTGPVQCAGGSYFG